MIIPKSAKIFNGRPIKEDYISDRKQKPNNNSSKDKTHCKLFPLMFILFVCGIDLLNTKRTSKLKRKLVQLYLLLTRIVWFAYFIYATTSFAVFDMSTFSRPLIVVSKKLWELHPIAVWMFMIAKKDLMLDQINKLFRRGHQRRSYLPREAVWLGTAYALIVPVEGWVFWMWDLGEKECKGVFENFFLKYLTLSGGSFCNSLQPIMLLYSVVTYTVPASVTAVYILLCLLMKMILRSHQKEAEDILQNHPQHPSIEQHYQKYNQTLKIFEDIERTMNFPALLSQIGDLIGMSASLIRLVLLRRGESYKGGSYFVGIRALLSFVLVSYFAASVNEADVNVKRLNVELMEVMEANVGKNVVASVQRIVSIGFKSHGKAFVLSGGGVMHFRKKYLFSALGSVLTYSLLIIQLYPR